MFRVSDKNTRTTLMTILNILNILKFYIFHTFFWCFYYWFWISKCSLGACLQLKRHLSQFFFSLLYQNLDLLLTFFSTYLLSLKCKKPPPPHHYLYHHSVTKTKFTRLIHFQQFSTSIPPENIKKPEVLFVRLLTPCFTSCLEVYTGR